MNILLIGSSSVLSSQVFKSLLISDYTLCAAGVANRQHETLSTVIATASEDIELLALEAGIPVVELNDVEVAIQQINALDIDVILVSCYGKRVPQRIAESATHGCFNIHPSLLPKFRGPEPVFWQFKHAAQFGVSIHLLTQQLDAGAIVKQQAVNLEDGCDYLQTNTILADTAVDLIAQLLAEIAGHKLQQAEQDETEASYYPYPEPVDFIFSNKSSAQQCFNFVRGTRYFDSAYQCQLTDSEISVVDVVNFDRDKTGTAEIIQFENSVLIQCNPGVLKATLS